MGTDKSREHWLDYLRHSGGGNAAFNILCGLYHIGLSSDDLAKACDYVRRIYEAERVEAEKQFEAYCRESRIV